MLVLTSRCWQIPLATRAVELSNTRTYVMHIPTTLSLTSARNNHKQKLQQRFSSVNFISIMLLHMLFFYGGHLVLRSKRCAMQNQGITFMAASLIFKCIEGAGVGDYSSRGRWGVIKIEKYFSRLLPNLPRPLSRFDTPQRCLKGLTEK